MIHHGDCLAILPTLAAESIDAIVTDPPYGLGFMGKAWDHGAPGIPFWAEMLRVAKPGAYLLAFGGTRTVHRIATAIEDAGWEIRDTLVWAYASGFPKSRNLDGEWQGWGTALKPAWEPIIMARKPLRGTVAGNVAEYGTGALNIDGCRIVADDTESVLHQPRPTDDDNASWSKGPHTAFHYSRKGEASASRRYGDEPGDFAALPGPRGGDARGRWPANVILTDPIFDGDTPSVVGGGEQSGGGYPARRLSDSDGVTLGTSGTYSRFFLIPKADRSDREPIIPTGSARVVSVWGGDEDDLTPGKKSTIARTNVHPTVKPTELMRHLVRLVTPPGGTVLDPFLGSGTTALACEAEGFAWIGIEREAEYVAIAEARLNGTQRGLGLDVPAPTTPYTSTPTHVGPGVA